MYLQRFAFAIAVCLGASLGYAQTPSTAATTSAQNPRDLVRKAIENELTPSTSRAHYMFRDEKKKNGRPEEVKQMLETADGIVVGRLISVAGKPLDAEQRAKEDQRLQRLVDDPEQVRQKKKEQNEDEERVRKMVGALPDAFNYEYVRTEPSKFGELVVLKFIPNPDYRPPSREQQVYAGMEGTMKIAVPQNRLALVDAKLFQDVNFGWGILGRLNKGGHFEIVQQEVVNGRWDTTRMVLDFTGKILLIKTLKIQQDETASDYQTVPDMSIAQALNMLKKVADGELAQNDAIAHDEAK